MPGFSNKGMYRMFDAWFRNAAPPTNFFVALVTSATAPAADTNTLSDLTQIAAGNGYTTGGFSLDRNTTDFDSNTENDASDRDELQIKDVTWTASSGTIPASGNGARYAVLTDDNATVGSREVIFWWDLSSNRTISSGQTLTLANLELRTITPVGWTNKGMFRMMDFYFRNQNEPTVFYLGLITSAAVPDADTNTLSQLTQIASGNGYTTNGISVARDSTDFDSLTENDTDDRAEIQMKNQVWTASTGSLPASGDGARYAVLTDDNATAGSRHVLSFFDLTNDRTVTVGNTITLVDIEHRGLN